MKIELTGFLRFLSPKNILLALLFFALLTREACHCVTERKQDKEIVSLQKQLLECSSGVVYIVDTASRKDTSAYPKTYPVPKAILKATTPSPRPRIVSKAPVAIHSKPDTLQLIDTAKAFPGPEDFAVRNPCNDTAVYSDTESTKYGNVLIAEKVSGNRVVERSLKTDFVIPTETITKIKEIEKRHAQVYIGINALGTKTNFLQYGGASLALKTKRDLMYEAGVWVGSNQEYGFSGSLKFKIGKR